METMNPAPIVMFAYARPEHTIRTLEALSMNTLAGQSRLYIYVDGVKSDATEAVVNANSEVKRIVSSKKWCDKVEIIESSINKGLAKSIRDGVTEVVNRYGKVIVVEDDLVTSPAFLSYMNKALDFYEKYPAVFSIGGYTYPSGKMTIPDDYPYDTYACLRNCSWGWATWKNRWDTIDWNATNYVAMKNNLAMRQAFNRMGDDEFQMFQQQQEKGLNIWSILFTMAHFENHAVAIIPCKSYVDNIGLDGSGENCGVQTALSHASLCDNENPHFLDVVYEDKRIINAFYNVNCRQRLPFIKRALNRISKSLGIGIVYLKREIYA